MVGGLFVWWFQLNGGPCGLGVRAHNLGKPNRLGPYMIDSKGNVRPEGMFKGRTWPPKPSAHTIRCSSACSTGRRVARLRRMRAWIPSRRSYSFTLSDVTHRTACAAPGYIAPEVLQLMEIAGISDFESLAASTNAPVFTPQTDDFGLAVHIFKMLNRGIHPYASGELDLDIFDLDDDDIPPAPLINSCVCNGHSPFVGTLVGYVVPKYALELDDFSGTMGEALRRSLYGRAEERLDARTWARLLDRYLSETVVCKRGHLHHSLQHECPCCRGERALLTRLG